MLMEKLFLGNHPKDGRQLELAGQQVGGQPSYGSLTAQGFLSAAGWRPELLEQLFFWVDLPLKGRPLKKVDC